MRKYALVTKITLAMVLAAILGLTGCANKQAKSGKDGGYERLELRYQGWAGSVLYPELAEDLGYLAPLKLKWIGNTISGPQDIQAVASGDIEFGGAFAGAIINLKAANAPVKWVISHYGVDDKTYSSLLVLKDGPIKNGRDLIGKKVGVNTLGAHSEFITKEYLRRQGLKEDEIKQVSLVVLPPVSAEQALRQNQVEGIIAGGILQDQAVERGGVRSLFSDYELYGKFSAGGYVLKDKFIKENPNTARKFVEATAKAIEWAQTTPRDEVIARFEKIIKERNRNEDTSPLKYWKSTGIAGKGGVTSDKEVQTWIDFLVKDGKLKEGQVKPSDVYTNEFNPYATENKK